MCDQYVIPKLQELPTDKRRATSQSSEDHQAEPVTLFAVQIRHKPQSHHLLLLTINVNITFEYSLILHRQGLNR
jgi:hypothetical protein